MNVVNYNELLLDILSLRSGKGASEHLQNGVINLEIFDTEKQNKILTKYNEFKLKVQYLREIKAIIPSLDMMVQIFETTKKILSKELYRSLHTNISNCLNKMALFYSPLEMKNLHTLLTLIMKMCELCIQLK